MESIPIRSIQHYLYCPHRWGLMEIDCAWAENYFVVKANLLHERVHSSDRFSGRGKKVHTAVSVWNDDYGIYGVTDCIEETARGLCIVEYKPTKPKNADWSEDDAMQVYAQKLCVDAVFGGNCEAVLYYADVKQRVRLPLAEQREEFDAKLRAVLLKMREALRNGTIPPIRRGQPCSGCSLRDICIPKLRTAASVRSAVTALLEETL